MFVSKESLSTFKALKSIRLETRPVSQSRAVVSVIGLLLYSGRKVLLTIMQNTVVVLPPRIVTPLLSPIGSPALCRPASSLLPSKSDSNAKSSATVNISVTNLNHLLTSMGRHSDNLDRIEKQFSQQTTKHLRDIRSME